MPKDRSINAPREYRSVLPEIYSIAVPWRGGLVRSGCLDCLTETGIVGEIVAGRIASLVRPACNDSAVRGPRGSFEATCPGQPATPRSKQEKNRALSQQRRMDPRLRGDDTQ
ncbi:MAG: hypothetical protein EOM37_16600 [Proteobacteria bacterium]|nr:hypothetical protein [Pseudomonadota bacterium]